MGLFSSTYPLVPARGRRAELKTEEVEVNSPGVSHYFQGNRKIPHFFFFFFIIRKLDEIEKFWRIILRPAGELA